MMKRLGTLIYKDIVLTSKNYFFYVTLFFAVLMILVILFVIPEDTNISTSVYAVFEYEVPPNMAGALEEGGVTVVGDRAALDAALLDNGQAIGMIYVDPLTVEYRLQGHESDRYKALLALNTRLMYGEFQEAAVVETVALKDYSVLETPPFNKLMLPLFHVMEPALLGLFLIATMIFSEKDEDTLTVYTTTPGGIGAFLLSKVVVMMLLGLISLLVTSLVILGLSANYLGLIALTLVCSFMGSAIGLLLASFFKNITGAMMWIVVLTMLMSFPFVTYFAPGFAPLWLKVMPTYSMLFAYKEAAFPTGNSAIIYETLAIGAGVGAVAYAMALMRYRRSLVR